MKRCSFYRRHGTALDLPPRGAFTRAWLSPLHELRPLRNTETGLSSEGNECAFLTGSLGAVCEQSGFSH